MPENRKVYESRLEALMARWKAASDSALESEKAWLEITAKFQNSCGKT